MKKYIFGALLLLASAAYAVSIEFMTLEAYSIGDLETQVSDDGSTVEYRIDILGGSSLNPLMAILPKVTSLEDGKDPLIERRRMLAITNAGQKHVDPRKETAIYFECRKTVKYVAIMCSIKIIKGIIPG